MSKLYAVRFIWSEELGDRGMVILRNREGKSRVFDIDEVVWHEEEDVVYACLI